MDELGRASLTDFVCWANETKCVDDLLEVIVQVFFRNFEFLLLYLTKLNIKYGILKASYSSRNSLRMF